MERPQTSPDGDRISESGDRRDPAAAPRSWTAHRVSSTGLRLAMREYLPTAPPAEGGPTAVLVHGYPDRQQMWEPVATRLGAAGIRVVTYDVRGAGDSDVPPDVAGYRVERLLDDLVSVLDAAVGPHGRVHLVGHDWGSVQLWEAALSEGDDPRLRGRLAGFTSVSGPALEHLRDLAAHAAGRRLRLLAQLGRSWYVGFFQVPYLPEAAWRVGAKLGPVPEEVGHDAVNGLNLYRANVLRQAVPRADRAPRRTEVPVLAVAPRRDPFLGAVTVEDLDRRCSDVRVIRPDTGHWLPRTHPDLLARLVLDHIRAHS